MADFELPIQLRLTTHNNGYGDITGGGLDSDVNTETEVESLIAYWVGEEGNEEILKLSISRRISRYNKRGEKPFINDPGGGDHLERITQEKGWLIRLQIRKAEVAATALLERENNAAVTAQLKGSRGVRVSLERRLLADGSTTWSSRRAETLAEVREGDFVIGMTALTGVVLSSSSETSATHFRLDFTVDDLAANGAAALRTAVGPLVESAAYDNLS